ncbi:hypothetical protein KXD93_23735 [Mucilaginibacter sp. BJC16-A38]|uniref:hypothetical protein n=1 Tax=Mucilaginibacter phenanthrenivorans TaxID=1234842 RepID=UPI002157DA42|nr:hypothetical protein [Mucilaginibacter phenanthrenivorans]MCR8560688.1 hypothetical protein [Mucilaginibacter phenanthrenivorans]
MNTNNSSPNNAITHAFEQIEVALNQKLKQQGYKIVYQQPGDESPSSRSITWLSNKNALRLTWEDTEYRFTLAFAATLPLSPETAWDVIITAPYNPGKHDEHYIVTIATEFVDRLRSV